MTGFILTLIHRWNLPQFLYNWQTLIAGLAALLAALIAVVVPEWRARKAVRASLASEVRQYVDLLIKTRHILTESKKAFRLGGPPPRDFRVLSELQPPVVYPAAADKFGLLGRPRAAAVVDFYATIERVNFTVRVLSKDPPEEDVSMSNYLRLINLFEVACRASLPLLSEFPFDKRDADFRAEIAKWDAERPPGPHAVM